MVTGGARDVRGHPAIAVKGAVQAAVAIVPHDCKVKLPTDPCPPRHHDLAIGLHGQRISIVVGACQVRGHLAIPVERGIQATIAVVPHHHNVVATAGQCEPRDHDLAVRLNGHRVAIVTGARDIRSHHRIPTERGIQAAVDVVPHHRNVVLGAATRLPCHHDLAVRLDGHRVAIVRGARDIRGHHTAPAEGAVQAAVAVVPHHRDVVVNAGVGRTRHHDLAVRLDGHRVAKVIGACDVGGHLAIFAEGAVQAAVTVVPHHRKVVVDAVTSISRHHELVPQRHACLNDDSVTHVIHRRGAVRCGHLAVTAERAIEISRVRSYRRYRCQAQECSGQDDHREQKTCHRAHYS